MKLNEAVMGRFFFHIMAAVAGLERGMISGLTKAGMAVIVYLRNNPKRLAAARVLENSGTRRKDGGLLFEGRRLMQILNEADKKAKPITNLATVCRWWRRRNKKIGDFCVLDKFCTFLGRGLAVPKFQLDTSQTHA